MAKKKTVKDVEAEEVKEEKEELEEEVPKRKRKIKDLDEVEKEEIEDDDEDEKVGDYDEIDVKKEKAKKKAQKDTYFNGVKKEMKKVQWAKGSEVFKNSIAVIIFVLIFIGFFELIDVLAALLKGWLS